MCNLPSFTVEALPPLTSLSPTAGDWQECSARCRRAGERRRIPWAKLVGQIDGKLDPVASARWQIPAPELLRDAMVRGRGGGREPRQFAAVNALESFTAVCGA